MMKQIWLLLVLFICQQNTLFEWSAIIKLLTPTCFSISVPTLGGVLNCGTVVLKHVGVAGLFIYFHSTSAFFGT